MPTDQPSTGTSPSPPLGNQESSPNQAPTLSLPKGGGAIRGIGEKLAANLVTGSSSLSVPLATSPGRSGFGPALSIAYDSGAGNGLFGLGWNLSLPAITRKTDKGLPKYEDVTESDVFMLSGVEDLVPVLVEQAGQWRRENLPPRSLGEQTYRIQRYRPRTEGLFARLERWTNQQDARDSFWCSISKDNVTTWYGKSEQSRVFDPNDPRRIFSWLICESYDDKGNAIVYEYATEDSAGIEVSRVHEKNRSEKTRSAGRYIKRIKYGNLPSRLVEPNFAKLSWLFEVVFDYDEGHCQALPKEAGFERVRFVSEVAGDDGRSREWTVRLDPTSSYRSGFELRTYRLCRRVLMVHHFGAELGVADYLVRSTELVYDESPRGSVIKAVVQSGYVRQNGDTYRKRSLPTLELEYSHAVISQEIRELSQADLENLPVGLDGATYRWVDLDAEGACGILAEQGGGWYYKRNLSPANIVGSSGHEHPEVKLGPIELVASKPNASLGSRDTQLLDLAGNGQLDVVSFSSLMPGFYERGDHAGWQPFRQFASWPQIDALDPNLKFIDLDGDGHADMVVTDDEALTWYPSLAEEGFGPARRVVTPADEEKGPRLLFADTTQSIYQADFTGDGLTDIVRIRNGEVCYWPNLGFGRFGAKVTMDRAPWLDVPEAFDHRRVRLIDVDGSGTADIIYLGRERVGVYRNQCGNSFSPPEYIDSFPVLDGVSSVMALDLLGNGTGCLVWSSPRSTGTYAMRYIDLMGGQKPRLLIGVRNNLGAETRVTYAPSTKFYVQDKLAGAPWVTRLPFPVHVVERVETYDHVSRNRFVTRYAYHHGCFDGEEREFRGFGMVEQWDTETFAVQGGNAELPLDENLDAASQVPPVLTKTWFHTGVYVGRDRISRYYAGLLDKDGGEYFREPGCSAAQAKALLLDDTELPPGLTTEEEREACRALRGSTLRQEVYALDGSGKQAYPYTVSEQSFTIRCLQPRAGNPHAVFFAHPREALAYNYERNPQDPRLGHTLTLEVDDFGTVRKSVAVGYGRRGPEATLAAADQAEQTKVLCTYTENDVTNATDDDDNHRAPLPCETRTYELTGYAPTGAAGRFRPADFVQPTDAGLVHAYDAELAYEEPPTTGRQRRLIERMRTLYRPDDFGVAQSNPLALLPLATVEARALPGEVYKQALTPGLVAAIYGGRVAEAMLSDEGRYVHSEGDGNWWIPSGRVFYSPSTNDAPAVELACAREHFFLPRRYRDPFHSSVACTETTVSYDAYDLLTQETRDALGNRVTAGERDVDASQPLARCGLDYRVLQPATVMDPNRNRAAAAFDALGMVVGTAVMGKPEASANEGDTLDGFAPDLAEDVVLAHLADPLADPHAVLGRATTRLVYDLFAYVRSKDASEPKPTAVYSIARETHDADLAPGVLTKTRHSFSYADGFGREIQKKAQAEPGLVPERDPATGKVIAVNGSPKLVAHEGPRWVGSGWTVFNNKGKPVRQYEPYFADTHDFELDARIGVSSVLFYDPVGRVVATLHANHTYEKVVFDPWQQASWDVNDTVLVADPKTDPHVGAFFRRLSDAEYLPTWYTARADGALGVTEKSAATKAAAHFGTPALSYADTLGRAFLTIAHNRYRASDASAGEAVSEERYETRVITDIEGNERALIDAKGRIVVRYDYDMLGGRIHQASIEAGERWLLNAVTGKPLYAWDSRGHELRTEYDVLRRPVVGYLRQGDGPEQKIGRTVYGESRAQPETKNLRGKAVEAFDQAGVVTTDDYDFKGNARVNRRQLAREYKTTLDWLVSVELEDAVYESRTRYDALNRPTEVVAPDTSILRPFYNEASLLERMEVNLRGANQAMMFVSDLDYDAKGQRLSIAYGNGVRTTYEYDPLTYRLVRLLTQRQAGVFPADRPEPPTVGWPGGEVQNLHYTYDPAGNITHVRDEAQQTIYFRNRRVEPSAEYTYDAIYRLVEATGREHLGQVNGGSSAPTAPDALSGFHTRQDQPGDGQAMGTYRECYVYDAVGNFLSMQHRGGDPVHAGWTRSYAYNEPSLIEPGKQSNRLSHTAVGDLVEPYSYEGSAGLHGNITSMPHLATMRWDYRDQLLATAQQVVNNGGAAETTWYVYDASGVRVRKVTERQVASGESATRKHERVYLGEFEIYREFAGDGATVTLERETLHVMDDSRRIAVVETRTQGSDEAPPRLVRYQFGNHLGSVALELDDQAQVVSYEEYYPYGGTSYQAVRSRTETPKRYRYTGKERDEESGLYYHGARYYAAWLGRWTATDPLWPRDGTSAFAYCGNNPIMYEDPDGRDYCCTPDGACVNEHNDPVSVPAQQREYCLKAHEEGGALHLLFPKQSPPSHEEFLAHVYAAVEEKKTQAYDPDFMLAQYLYAPHPEESTFWDRGGGTFTAGAATLGVGALAIASGPVGWAAALAGGLAFAAGLTGTGIGAVQLATSYSGLTTAKTDANLNYAMVPVMGFSSPSGIACGIAGMLLADDPEQGLATGTTVGGLFEAGATAAYGLGGMAYREWRFSQSYQGARYGWPSVRSHVQDVYGFGDPASRARANPLFYRGVERVDGSHFIPQRSIGGSAWLYNRPWNLRMMWSTDHALVDPYRYMRMTAAFKAAHAADQMTGITRFLHLAPEWMVTTGNSGASFFSIWLQSKHPGND